VADLGTITQGLGKLTPAVWQTLGETVRDVRVLKGQAGGRAQRYVNPEMFFAKITGYQIVQSESGSVVDGQIPNPKRVYVYDWEEVRFQINLNPNTDLDPPQSLVVVSTWDGARTSSDAGKALNLSEIGQPTSREVSFLGVMLDANQYPQVATVPTIHGADTNTAGSIEPSDTGTGPVVPMYLVECQNAEVKEVDDKGQPTDDVEQNGNQGNSAVGAVFYSPFNMDGQCGTGSDKKGGAG
jgi:hypothetical protein